MEGGKVVAYRARFPCPSSTTPDRPRPISRDNAKEFLMNLRTALIIVLLALLRVRRP